MPRGLCDTSWTLNSKFKIESSEFRNVWIPSKGDLPRKTGSGNKNDQNAVNYKNNPSSMYLGRYQ